MANFLRLPSVRFPVLLKRFVRPKVSLPRLKPLTFEILGERYGCAPVVGRDARHLSSTSDANNGENTPRSKKNSNVCKAHVTFDVVKPAAVKRNLSFEKGEKVQGLRPEKDVPNVKPDTRYHLWNPVSKKNGAILKRDSSNGKVFCDGEFKPPDPNTVVEFVDASKDHYYILFKNSLNTSVMIANGEGNEITTTDIQPPESFTEFEPIHRGIYTMFKQKDDDYLYLGCDSNGDTIMVFMKHPFFPTPRALFIVSEIKPQP